MATIKIADPGKPGDYQLIDAADFGGQPGEIRIAERDDVGGLMMGTHAPPLSMFMQLLSDDTGADVYLVAGIVAVALFVFIFAWQEYMFALTLTQTTDMRTLPVGLSLFIGFREVLWGPLMAGGVLMTLPVVIVFMYFQKYLVYGLTLGAVKQ